MIHRCPDHAANYECTRSQPCRCGPVTICVPCQRKMFPQKLRSYGKTRKVLTAVERGSQTSLEVERRTGIPRHEAAAILCSLEKAGAIERVGQRPSQNHTRPMIVWRKKK